MREFFVDLIGKAALIALAIALCAFAVGLMLLDLLGGDDAAL